LDVGGKLAQRRLGHDEAMRTRRGLGRRIEPDGTRRAHVGEVGSLHVHVIVDAEAADVVLPQEIGLPAVDGIALDDRLIVAVVPVGDLVRDDHVEPGCRGTLDDIERHERGRRDAPHLGRGPAELEGVAIAGIAPGRAEILPDACDDVSCGHAGLQYGSPALMCRTATPSTSGASQSASARIPGSSETMRPTSTSPLPCPACTASRTYSVGSRSRTSPATITSACAMAATDA